MRRPGGTLYRRRREKCPGRAALYAAGRGICRMQLFRFGGFERADGAAWRGAFLFGGAASSERQLLRDAFGPAELKRWRAQKRVQAVF